MERAIQIAEEFGNLIAKADYATAHGLLSKQAQKLHSPEEFRQAVSGMTEYAPGPIQNVQALREYAVYEWPAKQREDISIVYVSLEGLGFNEAVTVTLAHEDGDIRIRDLEWGRP